MSLLTNHPHFSYHSTNNSFMYLEAVPRGTRVTSGGTANTYGTWTQISSGLASTSEHLTVSLTGLRNGGNVISATVLNSWVDIGYGPDSTTVNIIVEKLGSPNAQGTGCVYDFPLRIPKNVPLFARHQCSAINSNVGVTWTVMGGNMNSGTWPFISNVRAFGVDASITIGTLITLGTNGAEGAWTQIIASTDRDYAGIMVSPIYSLDTTMQINAYYSVDVAIGPASSEVLIGENMTTQFTYSTGELRTSFSTPVFVHIPQGTRIAVRGSVSLSTGADATPSVFVYMLEG